jgi:hypothetical protein
MKQTGRIGVEWIASLAWECRLLPRRAGVDNKPVKRLRLCRRSLFRNPFTAPVWLGIRSDDWAGRKSRHKDGDENVNDSVLTCSLRRTSALRHLAPDRQE